MSDSKKIEGGDFDFVAKLVLDRAAIVLAKGKEYLVEARLSQLARNRGIDSIKELVAELRRAPKGELSDQVVDAMTTNETSWFRDIRPYQALEKTIIPALLSARPSGLPINIWSAACSSGQEPFSLSILLREILPENESKRFKILGTDISDKMLDQCNGGTYSQIEINRGLSSTRLVKNFTQEAGNWKICAASRDMVKFRKLNLIEPWSPMPKMDIVMIRNVLIYFDSPTKAGILNKIRSVMNPDGYLILGAGETTTNLTDSFKPEKGEGTIYYRGQ